MSVEKRYEKLLLNWIENAKEWIAEPYDRKDLAYYGTGTNIWGIQTHMKGFSAFATACELELPDGYCYTKEELIETSLKMLRFTLESHITGSYHCTDGEDVHWGHHWLATLATERMMHGIEAIEKYLTENDKKRIREVFTSEADDLCDSRKVEADPIQPNLPESNLWTGAFLHRSAIMFPDAKRAEEWKKHGTKLLLNSISVPSDKYSQKIYAGIPESEWHIGANFFESYGLNHHGYLNVGYMVICLSNIAMLHFSLKRQNISAPPELYHHFHELWQLVRSFVFNDGRLWRIGGDTRVRYCYCQDYLLPVILLAADLENEDMTKEELGWLEILEKETAYNGNGSFLSERCELFRERSPLYYTRLESDRATTVAMLIHWHKNFGDIAKRQIKPSKEILWSSDDIHGSYAVRNSERMASFTWIAAERPSGSIVPTSDSSIHEARHNLVSMIEGGGIINKCSVKEYDGKLIENGFITCGKFNYISEGLLEENDSSNTNAQNRLLFCALPDSKTVVTIQLCKALRRCHLTKAEPLNFVIPNDIFNDNKREYSFINENQLTVDDKLSVSVAYGGKPTVVRGNNRTIGIQHISMPRGSLDDSLAYSERGMLKVDKILSDKPTKLCWYDKDETIFDFAAVISVGKELPKFETFLSDGIRAVKIKAFDGKEYIIAMNLKDSTEAEVFGKKIDFSKSNYAIEVL